VAQPTLAQVLSWLPEDTETVMGANGPFPLPDLSALGGNPGQTELSIAELELRTRALPLTLFNFKNGGLSQALKGKIVAIVIEGSRHFRPPAGLGEMRYEGCEIVILDKDSAHNGDSFMQDAVKSANQVEDVSGTRIAVFEEQSENDVWTTFVAFPASNIVLIATDRDYLRTVLSRIKGSSGRRALPVTLPEWKQVNYRAPVWGLRHYQKLEAGRDPTSPFQGQAAGNVPDNSASGVGFWFEPAGSRVATVSYLSTNGNSLQILQAYLGAEDAASASPREFQVRLRQPAPGVIQGSVTLASFESFGRFYLGLLAMLGHAIYL
jgi:hypothetical protein